VHLSVQHAWVDGQHLSVQHAYVDALHSSIQHAWVVTLRLSVQHAQVDAVHSSVQHVAVRSGLPHSHSSTWHTWAACTGSMSSTAGATMRPTNPSSTLTHRDMHTLYPAAAQSSAEGSTHIGRVCNVIITTRMHLRRVGPRCGAEQRGRVGPRGAALRHRASGLRGPMLRRAAAKPHTRAGGRQAGGQTKLDLAGAACAAVHACMWRAAPIACGPCLVDKGFWHPAEGAAPWQPAAAKASWLKLLAQKLPGSQWLSLLNHKRAGHPSLPALEQGNTLSQQTLR
jgi:hypothetical protein